MLRIAIICKSLHKGGAEKQALFLAKSLAERDIDISLINLCFKKADPQYIKYIRDNSIRYFPLKGCYLIKLYRVQQLLRKEKVQLVLSYLTFANLVTGITRVFNKRIKTLGGIRNEKLPYHKFLIERFIHNRLNDFTIFNNYSAKEKFVKRGFSGRKIAVIQNAIEIEQLTDNKKTTSDGVIKIISVGRFVKQKDYITALNSFRNLDENIKENKFVYYIVGYGPLEDQIRSLARNLGIDHKLKMLINPPDIQSLLRTSDIFLSTSLFEGVSNSIMEAMIAGLPVVATDVGDNKHLVKNGYNGFLVPCKDVNQIVKKLEYLSVSEEKRLEFGRNSRFIIESGFSKEKLIENYLRLFSTIIH